jgi:hypothetical protein
VASVDLVLLVPILLVVSLVRCIRIVESPEKHVHADSSIRTIKPPPLESFVGADFGEMDLE